jgi:shikimate kinase
MDGARKLSLGPNIFPKAFGLWRSSANDVQEKDLPRAMQTSEMFVSTDSISPLAIGLFLASTTSRAVIATALKYASARVHDVQLLRCKYHLIADAMRIL